MLVWVKVLAQQFPERLNLQPVSPTGFISVDYVSTISLISEYAAGVTLFHVF